MNKKLLAAAIGAAVVASPAAFATSTVYGKIHNSVDMVDIEVGNATVTDNWQVNDRASRLGFKGSEDLGGGLKAIYQMEFAVTTSGGPAQAAGGSFGGRTRNTFVGLSGGFGTVLVGRHDTPAKVAFYAAGNDHLGDSIMDLNLGSVIGVFTENRVNNAIAYISPNFSGFTLAAAAVPGEENATATNNESDGIADHVSVGLMYKGGGLKASVGYEKLDNQAYGFAPAAPNDDSKMIQAGASYTFGAFSIGGQYEDTSNTGGADGVDYTAWAISGKATFGNNAITAIYTNSETDVPAALGNIDVDFDGWGISAEHNFSKRTKVYAAYASSEADLKNVPNADVDADAFSLGMIHNF